MGSGTFVLKRREKSHRRKKRKDAATQELQATRDDQATEAKKNDEITAILRAHREEASR